jgi:hypothetical protein
MTPISNLKHELQNRLREILSANLVFTFVTTLGPFGPAQALTLSKLEQALKDLEAQQLVLTASLKPGCDYFTLIRSAATMRKDIEEIRTSLDAYLAWAQSIHASAGNPMAEPALPPSA